MDGPVFQEPVQTVMQVNPAAAMEIVRQAMSVVTTVANTAHADIEIVLIHQWSHSLGRNHLQIGMSNHNTCPSKATARHSVNSN